VAERRFRIGTAISLGGIVAAAPLVAACGGSSYDNWAATDGAGGRINLDDVQAAFKDSKSATEFEDKVNRIYEGDGVVLIRSKQDDSGLTLEGWEDLNGNSDIDDASDDQLFSIVKGNDNQHNMRGHNGNGYYRSSFGGGDFLMTYMLISAFSPRGYYYNTPVSRGTSIRNQRTTYRKTSGYNRQVQRNSNFNRKFSGSRFQQAKSNVSSNRRTYQQRQRSSGAFRTSSSVSRSSPRSSFRSSGRSGGRGGGGAMVVRGQRRF
jgi:hypothetical protein